MGNYFNRMKKIILALSLICLTNLLLAQEFLGYANSNYAGIYGIHLQPASIVDSRIAFDFNFVGINTGLGNNLAGFKLGNFFLKDTKFEFTNTGSRVLVWKNNGQKIDIDSTFTETYIVEQQHNRPRSLFFNNNIYGPSFMLNIKNKHSFAITTNVRSMMNMDNLDPYFSIADLPPILELYPILTDLFGNFYDSIPKSVVEIDLLARGLKYAALFGTISNIAGSELNNDEFGLRTMSWAEVGLTYGTVLINKEEHFLKGAFRAKYMKGIGAAYLDFDNLRFKFYNTEKFDTSLGEIVFSFDSVLLEDATLNYGFSAVSLDTLDPASPLSSSFDVFKYLKGAAPPSFGFDLGLVYEYRPDYNNDRFFYSMDGNPKRIRHDLNKYKFKFGVSLLDIGAVKFNTDPLSRQYTFSSKNMDFSLFDWCRIDTLPPDTLKVCPTFEQIDSILLEAYQGTKITDPTFKMRLPTALSLQFDYNIWKSIYINTTAYIAFKSKPKGTQAGMQGLGVNQLTRFSITPRWELEMIDIAFPISFDGYRKFNFGVNVRLATFVFGTNNLGALLSKKSASTGINLYAAVKFPIHKRVPKDKDNDLVSNRKDKCKKVPGVWAFKGCPDTDKDGIPDDEDACPTRPGPPENNGCPYKDRDRDGVLDKEDDCPDVPGLVELKGCPPPPEDRDGDSVIDEEDDCPDEPGLVELNGCPEEEEPEEEAKEGLCEAVDDDAVYFREVLEKCGDLQVEGLKFKIQIGAYTKPPSMKYFDFVKDLGKLEKVQQGGLTKFLIGEYMNTLIETDKYRAKVRKRIPDTFIAFYYNGKRLRLRQALDLICAKCN